IAAVVALSRAGPWLRLAAGLAALICIFVAAGLAGDHLTPEGDRLARVSPASGFWMLTLAFALLVTDAISRLALPPLARIACLAAAVAALGAALSLGVWDSLSLMKEYGN